MQGRPSPARAVARLARCALEPGDLLAVFDEAVDVLVATLGTEHVTILETSADGSRARVRAGVGWREGVVGAEVDVMGDGHLAYTLGAESPVVVESLADETRFTPSPLLLAHGVTSSLAARIAPAGGGRPFGILGVHTAEHRRFTDEEAALAETVAAVLALAIARWRQALALDDTLLQALVTARYALAAGDRARALAHLDAALEHTREIVGETLGEHTLPGDLRRT